jgi:hypothetical protein
VSELFFLADSLSQFYQFQQMKKPKVRFQSIFQFENKNRFNDITSSCYFGKLDYNVLFFSQFAVQPRLILIVGRTSIIQYIGWFTFTVQSAAAAHAGTKCHTNLGQHDIDNTVGLATTTHNQRGGDKRRQSE